MRGGKDHRLLRRHPERGRPLQARPEVLRVPRRVRRQAPALPYHPQEDEERHEDGGHHAEAGAGYHDGELQDAVSAEADGVGGQAEAVLRGVHQRVVCPAVRGVR